MPWLRVDDQLGSHRKWIGLSPAAKATWLDLAVHCAANLTDGHVQEPIVRALASGRAAISELEERGLLDRNGNGWIVHDFLDFNPSREQVETGRKQRAAAGKRGGLAKANRAKTSRKPPNDF